ncbi:MAG: UBC-like protein [Aureobasidium pullulans]|uniref:Putative amino acid permease n=1 Tax=Aureobasidium pullulans TaxID=5580 RepID=A0A1A7MJL9_AURPU|nr:MAG: UBC-like protein [Aureobasidium pullulans]THW36574.1 putative amino acid permease [Aureobasidium pullulans]
MPFWDKNEKVGDSVSQSPSDPFHRDSTEHGEVHSQSDHLQRRLGNRQIQLIAIGGSIGTALFVSIGGGLARGGPGSLFVAYFIYSCFLGLVNNCIAEMTVLYPVEGGFIRLAGHLVDEAFGFMAGWNFFLYEALLIPFEITALTTVLGYWSDNIPPWSIPIACIVLYGLLNVLAVKAYGEAEFWLSGGKVILIFLLFAFTFVTMVGGNPQHDAYGFRNWNDGAFAMYRTMGTLGRFEGFCAALWSASFCVVGPEYISMVSAEAKRPRTYIKTAFKTVYWRFGIFFIAGALFAGIVVSHTDPELVAIVSGTGEGGGTAAASPYVIAMKNMGIVGLPHFVNALLVTSIFSAGNTYTYCATRSLHGMAVEGRAPALFRKCTKGGVPIYCFIFVMCFPCLAFLQVSSGSNKVLTWLVNLITAGGIINYIVMTTTYIFFWRALKAQGVDRKLLPYCGWFQPWSAYIGLAWMIMIVTCYGYTSFAPWSTSNFFIYYTMLLLGVVTFTFWKVFKRTTMVRPHTADLVWERPAIDAYEASFLDPPNSFWNEMLGPLRKNKGSDRQASDSGNYSGME